jgi:hypothetical protein
MPEEFEDELNTSLEPEADAPPAPVLETHADVADAPFGPTFNLSIYVEPPGILCQFQCEGRSQEWTMPRTVVRRANKAMSVDHVFDLLGAGPIVGYYLSEAVTNEPEFLMVPRAVNALTDRVTKALRQVRKEMQKAAQAASGDSIDS